MLLAANSAARQLDLEHIGAIAAAVAIGAAQIHVGEKLHFDVLETVAAAGRAAAIAGIEAEGSRGVLALASLRLLGE